MGTHFPKVDDKNRFVLPAKFREELRGGLVIARGQERCLAIYTVEEFQRQFGQFQAVQLLHSGEKGGEHAFVAGERAFVQIQHQFIHIGQQGF